VFDNNRKTDDNVVSKDFGTFSGKDLYISLWEQSIWIESMNVLLLSRDIYI
jgi:hypothetical protein